MEYNKQKANLNGNGINFEFTNTKNSNEILSQEKLDQETPINQNFSQKKYTFKSSLNPTESTNLNQNINYNAQKGIFEISQNENNQNSENFLLKNKREHADFNDDGENLMNSNQITEEKNGKKNKIKRLVITTISSAKKFLAKHRFVQNENENEIQNFNRQGFFSKMNSTHSIYSVNCPNHHLENHVHSENKIVGKNLYREFGNNENKVNLNLNENEDEENFGKFLLFFRLISIL